MDSEKSLFVLLVSALAFATLASCGNSNTSSDSANLTDTAEISEIDPKLVDATTPLGLSWSTSDENKARLAKLKAESCQQAFATLAEYFGESDEAGYLDECLNELTAGFFISEENVPEYFRDGSVSFYLNEHSAPIAYEYSYLHETLGAPKPELAIQRNQKSDSLRQALISLYGKPAKTGHFDQSSRSGFVQDKDNNAPCQLWNLDDIDVLLCSERVIMIDGLEMSLSYIHRTRIEGE